jgi:general secretion pathway protein M
MIDQAKIFWVERSVRERVLIAVMLTLIGAMLIWLGVVRPIDRASSRAEARHQNALLMMASTTAKAAALKAERAKPALPLASDVATRVRTSAEAAGFTLGRADPGEGDRVMIAIVSAKSPALFGWLAQLESEGMFVERANIRVNSDATLGFDATLRARVG